IRVHERRDLAVRTDRDKLGLELVVLTNVDRVHAVRQAEFFEHDGYLAPVRRGPRIKIQHRFSWVEMRRCGDDFDYDFFVMASMRASATRSLICAGSAQPSATAPASTARAAA